MHIMHIPGLQVLCTCLLWASPVPFWFLFRVIATTLYQQFIASKHSHPHGSLDHCTSQGPVSGSWTLTGRQCACMLPPRQLQLLQQQQPSGS